MEIIMRPPVLLLVVPLGVLVAILASMLLKQGDWKRKTVALAVAGLAVGSYRLGRFRLAGGATARVAAQQAERALVLLDTGDGVCLLAPDAIDELLTAVSRYHPVEGWAR